MRSNLSIKGLGLSVSAALAVPYVLLMFGSLFLVGFLTTGSWQAAFLTIGWSTILGFEIGLLAVVILAFALAAVFVPIYSAFRRQSTSRPGASPAPAWASRLLAACIVLPALGLILLRVLAPGLSFSPASAIAGVNAQRPTAHSQPVNLGPMINTVYREAEPSFTADGRTMYFNCKNGDICVSHLVGTWEEGNWTPPERLGSSINTEYEEIEPVINGAGDTLYFTSIRPQGLLQGVPFLSPFVDVFEVVNRLTMPSGRVFFGGLGLDDVWVSHRVNGAWSEPQYINDVPGEPHINTPFADHCLFFSSDGNEAFWTSTRPGGYGDDDIWTSQRVDGAWTQPENLGPDVNGPGSEHTSIPTPDGQSLYVTTTRAAGYGGEDNYVSTRAAGGRWGPLVNLGPLVNGPGDDRCPAWTPDLKFFLFDSVREGGLGGRDIWWMNFENVAGHPLGAESAAAVP